MAILQYFSSNRYLYNLLHPKIPQNTNSSIESHQRPVGETHTHAEDSGMIKMKCGFCGASITPDKEFCPKCGWKAGRYTPKMQTGSSDAGCCG